MKKQLIAIGLAAALALPTAALAARHASSTRFKPRSAATAPHTRAKSHGSRSGVALKVKRSKTVPASAKTRTRTKPRVKNRSSRKPRAGASAGRSRTAVRTQPNGTAGTPGVTISVGNGGSSGASGSQGPGGIDLPISLNDAGV
jgi:hypothetical protein